MSALRQEGGRWTGERAGSGQAEDRATGSGSQVGRPTGDPAVVGADLPSRRIVGTPLPKPSVFLRHDAQGRTLFAKTSFRNAIQQSRSHTGPVFRLRRWRPARRSTLFPANRRSWPGLSRAAGFTQGKPLENRLEGGEELPGDPSRLKIEHEIPNGIGRIRSSQTQDAAAVIEPRSREIKRHHLSRKRIVTPISDSRAATELRKLVHGPKEGLQREKKKQLTTGQSFPALLPSDGRRLHATANGRAHRAGRASVKGAQDLSFEAFTRTVLKMKNELRCEPEGTGSGA